MRFLSQKKGFFLTCEGPDGSGKTTASNHLIDMLKNKGFEVYKTREPGGTVIAEKIRGIILSDHENEDMAPMTELILFAAARAQHIEKVIKPQLELGKVVVCDRFSDSTFAYQGAGRGYIKDVMALEKIVHKGFEPDLTMFFDVTLEESIRRISLRQEVANRLDTESILFKSRVYEGFKLRMFQQLHRVYHIDAMQDIEGVNKQLQTWVDIFSLKMKKEE